MCRNNIFLYELRSRVKRCAILTYRGIGSHHRYFRRPGATGGGRQTTENENGRHFKAFCEKRERAPLENSWLMQVPRYRTAYNASLLLWSIWICHCVKLALRILSLSLSVAPLLSLLSHSVSPSFCLSFSRSRTLFALQSSFLFISLCALPLSPSFPLRKFAMLHGEEQKSISRVENWVTETSLVR